MIIMTTPPKKIENEPRKEQEEEEKKSEALLSNHLNLQWKSFCDTFDDVWCQHIMGEQFHDDQVLFRSWVQQKTTNLVPNRRKRGNR